MLQQTQVETVVPFFKRFLRAFPNFGAISRAKRERVLELWAGLGYYRRARDLHRAARIITRRLGGQFPRTYAAARSLPGVGDYTARAVLSIGYNLPFAVLDGNVARVVARWRLIRGHAGQPGFRRRVEGVLGRWLSGRRPGAFNQAVMELGQTICLPRAPRCPICPIRRWCRAYRRDRPEFYPSPRPRRASEPHHLALAVIRDGGKFALVRGLGVGLLSDLWNFPAAFGASPVRARTALAAKLATLIPDATLPRQPAAEFRHQITHRSINAQVYALDLVRASVAKISCSGVSPSQSSSRQREPMDSRLRGNDHGDGEQRQALRPRPDRIGASGAGPPVPPHRDRRYRSAPAVRWLAASRLDSAAVSALTRKTAAAQSRAPSASL